MGVRSGRHCAPVVHVFPRWSVPLGVIRGGKFTFAAPHVWRDPGLLLLLLKIYMKPLGEVSHQFDIISMLIIVSSVSQSQVVQVMY